MPALPRPLPIHVSSLGGNKARAESLLGVHSGRRAPENAAFRGGTRFARAKNISVGKPRMAMMAGQTFRSHHVLTEGAESVDACPLLKDSGFDPVRSTSLAGTRSGPGRGQRWIWGPGRGGLCGVDRSPDDVISSHLPQGGSLSESALLVWKLSLECRAFAFAFFFCVPHFDSIL